MTAPPTHHFVLRMSRSSHLLSITSARLLGAGMPRELSSSALHMMRTGHIRIHPPSARRKVLRIGRLTARARSILGANVVVYDTVPVGYIARDYSMLNGETTIQHEEVGGYL